MRVKQICFAFDAPKRVQEVILEGMEIFAQVKLVFHYVAFIFGALCVSLVKSAVLVIRALTQGFLTVE